MIAELPIRTASRIPSGLAVSASGVASFLLGASFFCWAHLGIARSPFPGSPASHDVLFYASEILAVAVAALAAWRSRKLEWPRLVLLGGVVWLAACLVSSWSAIDPVLGLTWTAALLVAMCCLLAGVHRPGLTAGMALGVLGSLPIMLFQVIAQTTWPTAAIEGWPGGELTGAVRGAAVLGEQRWLRPYGFTLHPNIAGGLAAVACVLLTAAWFRERRVWQLPLVAAAFAETLLSFSRSAWIAALLGLAALALIRRANLRPLLLALALPTLLFVITLGGLALQRTAASGTLEDDSVSQRIYLAQTALQVWRGHPLFGIGPAQFNQREVDLYGPSFIPEPVHNAILLVLAETGMVGLAGATLVVAGIARRIKLRRDWGALGVGLALLSPLMLDHYLLTSPIGLVLLAGVLAQDVSDSATRAVSGLGRRRSNASVYQPHTDEANDNSNKEPLTLAGHDAAAQEADAL